MGQSIAVKSDQAGISGTGRSDKTGFQSRDQGAGRYYGEYGS